MQPTLTRERYDRQISELLAVIFDDPQQLQQAFRSQYPKPAALVESELRFRGLEPPALSGKVYTREQVDAMAEILEGLDRLTDHARGAKSFGWNIGYYRDHWDIGLADRDGWEIVEAGGKLELSIPVGHLKLEGLGRE